MSLRSGRRVADALREAGAEVEVRDIDAELLRRAPRRPRPTACSRCCTARPGRTAPYGRSSSCSACPTSAPSRSACRAGVRQAGRQGRGGPRRHLHPAERDAAARDLPRARRGRRDGRDRGHPRPAADRQARPWRLRPRLYGGPRRVRAARCDGRRLRLRRHRARRAARGGRRGRRTRRRHRRGPPRAAGRLDRARRRRLRLHRPLHRRQHRVRGARQALRRAGRGVRPGRRARPRDPRACGT